MIPDVFYYVETERESRGVIKFSTINDTKGYAKEAIVCHPDGEIKHYEEHQRKAHLNLRDISLLRRATDEEISDFRTKYAVSLL